MSEFTNAEADNAVDAANSRIQQTVERLTQAVESNASKVNMYGWFEITDPDEENPNPGKIVLVVTNRPLIASSIKEIMIRKARTAFPAIPASSEIQFVSYKHDYVSQHDSGWQREIAIQVALGEEESLAGLTAEV